MQYQFDIEIARRFGLDEAVFVHNLAFWILKNTANGRHVHDGKVWTYNSSKALAQIFPFWSPRQIERVVNSCRDKGLIETANLSENRRDRTLWYTITETVKCIYANGEMDSTKRWQPFTQTVECIKGTDSKPDSNTDIAPKRAASEFAAYAGEDEELLERLRDFEEMRKKKRKPMTQRAWKLLFSKLDELSAGRRTDKLQMLDRSILKCWDTVYPLEDKGGVSCKMHPVKTALIEEEWVANGNYED